LSSSTNAQLYDADAFFKGTYDKAFIRKHKIKQVFVDIFINGKKSTFYIFQFDKKGFLKKQTILDSLRKNVNDYIFKYNKYGDQIERINIAYDLNKTYKVTFLKNYKGSQLVSDKSSELSFLTIYSYNSKGQIKETSTISRWDSLNKSKRISIYNYGTTGKLLTIKDLIVNSNGTSNVLETTTFAYDTNGRIVSVFRDNAPAYYLSYDNNSLIKSKRIKMPEDLGGLEMIDKYSYSFWE
jgi:hypothetical protein